MITRRELLKAFGVLALAPEVVFSDEPILPKVDRIVADVRGLPYEEGNLYVNGIDCGKLESVAVKQNYIDVCSWHKAIPDKAPSYGEVSLTIYPSDNTRILTKELENNGSIRMAFIVENTLFQFVAYQVYVAVNCSIHEYTTVSIEAVAAEIKVEELV